MVGGNGVNYGIGRNEVLTFADWIWTFLKAD
jgi:hypothetical protein